jgi:hypothetical protein
MAKLIHSATTSLAGYVADEDGNLDWAAPGEEVHAFVNDLERPVDTSRPTRSGPDWSTRVTSCSRRSWSEAGRGPSPTTSA